MKIIPIDFNSFKISEKAEEHLRQLPSARVLKKLGKEVLRICRSEESTEDGIALVNRMLCHIDIVNNSSLPYQTISEASIANSKDMFLYRVRAGRIGDDVSECWSPPAGTGMPNRINEQIDRMLYLSRHPSVCFAEAKGVTGKVGTQNSLIVFQIRDSMRLSHIGYPSVQLPKSTEFENNFYTSSQAPERKSTDPELTKKVEVLTAFLVNMFTGPESHYPISRHICRYFKPLSRVIDGWLYPSVQILGTQTNEANVCLLQDRADEKLELVQVICLSIARDGKHRVNDIRKPEGGMLARGTYDEVTNQVFSQEVIWGFWKYYGLYAISAEEIAWPLSQAHQLVER